MGGILPPACRKMCTWIGKVSVGRRCILWSYLLRVHFSSGAWVWLWFCPILASFWRGSLYVLPFVNQRVCALAVGEGVKVGRVLVQQLSDNKILIDGPLALYISFYGGIHNTYDWKLGIHMRGGLLHDDGIDSDLLFYLHAEQSLVYGHVGVR